MVMHQPWDALEAPRFTGPRTFARLPHVTSLEGAHAAVFGMPWDGGTSFRSGARFGPEAVRSASGMIRTYNAVQRVQVFGALSTVDFGDAPTVPGYIEDTLERIEGFVRPIAEAGVIPLGIGGDHSVTLAELRALAARARAARPAALRLPHGSLGLLQRAPLQPRDDVPAGDRGGHRSTPRARSRSACAGRSTAPTTRPSRTSSAWR